MFVKLEVELLEYTPNALSIVYAAMKQCYSDGYASAFAAQARVTKESIDCHNDNYALRCEYKDIQKYINSVLSSGHESPIEHISFTFAVSGISRALSHQLVRHRIASYSQQSQRYVDANCFNTIIPPNIEAIPEARERFIDAMAQASMAYEDIQEILINAGHAKTANEDARFVLPNACETRIVFTMNARALLHFFNLRCCERAQWEIRNMANLMLRKCQGLEPLLFAKAGASCVRLGYCPEGKRSCGKAQTLEQIMEKSQTA